MTTLPLNGTGTTRSAGTGVFHGKLHLTGAGASSSAGTGDVALPPFKGAAQSEGIGQVSWSTPPKPPGLEDIWFYGSATRKSMPGRGTAASRGLGTVTLT